MNNTTRSLLLAWALATGVSIPVHWENNHPKTIDEQREVIITSVNTLLQKEWKQLRPGEKCVITVFGKKEELKAILACNGTQEWTHKHMLKEWEIYVTQIFDIKTTSQGLLNTQQWCIIMQVPRYEEIRWNQCEETQEESNKNKKPNKRWNVMA